MSRIYALAKPACFVVLFAILSACSQSTSSYYSSGYGFNIATTKDQRQAKILAARKRARAASIAKRAAFKQRRLDRRNKKAIAKTVTVKRKKVSKTSRTVKLRTAKKSKVKAKRYKLKRSKKAFIGKKSRAVGSLKINASWKCVPSRLKKVIAQVRRRYGAVTINSTYRSRSKNRRAGGKKKSYHLHCRAVDFRVHGRTRGLTRFLARHPLVGGWKRYPSGFYHIDTGPKRTW